MSRRCAVAFDVIATLFFLQPLRGVLGDAGMSDDALAKMAEKLVRVA